MQFIPATESDFEAVMAIIEDGRAALGRLGIDQWQGGSPTPDMVRADLEAGDTMLAVQGDKLLGTLAFVGTGEPDYANIIEGSWLSDHPLGSATGSPRSENEGATFSPEAAERPAAETPCPYVTLHRVAVAADSARQGVATFMTLSSIELARKLGFKSVRVDTHEGNIPMQRMLGKCGFTHCCDIELSLIAEKTKKRLGYEILLA